MKHPGSEITTQPATHVSATGMPLGGRGLATQDDTRRAAAWLVKHCPAEVDRAALSRASSLNAGLTIRMIEGLPMQVSVTGSPDARRQAANAMAGFFSPAPGQQIEEWIAELSVITRRKQDDDITERLRLSAYVWRLAEYPADVARAL